jgi:hypothetical protein
MVSALPAAIRLPIAIVSGTPTDAYNPTPMPVIVAAILILVVMPLIAISIVMAAVMIGIVSSMVTISRGWLWKKTGDTEYRSEQ